MDVRSLGLSEIHGSDPIGKFLLGRLKIRPIFAALFFVAAGILYGLVLPLLWHLPMEVDGINILNTALVFPMVGFFYAYQPHSILRTYSSVTRFLREEEQSHTIHFDKIARTHASRFLWIIGLAFGLLGAGFGVSYSFQHFGEFSYSANWFQIIFVHLVRFLAFYFIGVSAGRHIATSIELNGLFEHADFPLTLDSDRLEVFKQVRNFALEFVGVAAILALNLGLQPLLIDPPLLEYIIYVSLYFVIAPFSFFLPIWEAHRRMVRIKDKLLDKLHYDFQEESQRLYHELDKTDSPLEYLERTELLSQLEKSIATVSKTLVWPFEGTTIYRLVVTVVSPFVLVIFEVFINVTGNLLVAF